MSIASLKKIYADHPVWFERLALCIAVLLAYASVWPNEFIFDDTRIILANPLIMDWHNIPRILTGLNFQIREDVVIGFYRPVPILLYVFLIKLFGLSTVAFHALNIAVHALNACLLHHFGTRLGLNKGVPFAAALLWAVHPLATEAVTYMSSTHEMLWATFCLAGLIVLLPDFSTRRIWMCLPFFLLALGSKEIAVVFPALAVATLFYVSAERFRLSTYLKTWPLWVIGFAYAAAWMIFMHKSGYVMDESGDPLFHQQYTNNIINRILTCLATLPVYTKLIVWPTGLHMEKSFPVVTSLWAGLPLLGLSIVAGCAWQLIRRRTTAAALAISFAILWFGAGQALNTGIFFPTNARITEHWMYLPLMGICLGVAQVASGMLNKKTAIATVCVIAALLGTATFMQNEKWRDPPALYNAIASNGGNILRISSHLGIHYMKLHEYDKAAEQFQYVIDHPDGSSRQEWISRHTNLAMALLHVNTREIDGVSMMEIDDIVRALPSSQRIPEAIDQLSAVIRLAPDHAWTHAALAELYHYQGDSKTAGYHVKKVEEILQKRKLNGP